MGELPLVVRGAALVTTAVLVAMPFGCNDHPLKQVRYSNNQVGGVTVPLSVNKDVDVLFVIDNSGSMGEEQGNLAAQFDRFINKLEEAGANYRIGITTTDNGNPLCTGVFDTNPEAGALQLVTCRERGEEEFTFKGEDETIVRFTEGCLAQCKHQEIDILPTKSNIFDPEEKPRTWLENIGGVTNVGNGVPMKEALQCFGPQGIAGCGMESPLDTMAKALTRAQDENDPDFGFLRPHALLAVVFVTDEVDCSYNPAHAEVFAGNQTFWSTNKPTSAICWNAGVECTGEGPVYDDCRPANKDADGNIIDDPERALTDAVLWPVERYIGILQAIEDAKRKATEDADHEVIVAAISGVPTTYPSTAIPYADATDPTEQGLYGIGPGCSAMGLGRAFPPVRLRAFADAFATRDENGDVRPNLFSVCTDDYVPALQAVADELIVQLQPACLTSCARDDDPIVPGLQPSCTISETTKLPNGEERERTLEPCTEEGELPAGMDACYVARTDADRSTDTTIDDMSLYCVENNYNLEFDIVRVPGTEQGPTSISATCELSTDCENDCPGITHC